MTTCFVNARIRVHTEVHLEEPYLADTVLQCLFYAVKISTVENPLP